MVHQLLARQNHTAVVPYWTPNDKGRWRVCTLPTIPIVGTRRVLSKNAPGKMVQMTTSNGHGTSIPPGTSRDAG